MNAADYRPVYDDSVYEYLPNWQDASGTSLTDSAGNPTAGTPAARVQWPINKQYCLTNPSAILLASLFDPKPAIVSLPPIAQAGGFPDVDNDALVVLHEIYAGRFRQRLGLFNEFFEAIFHGIAARLYAPGKELECET